MILDWVGLAAQPVEEIEPAQNSRDSVSKSKEKIGAPPRKGKQFEPAKDKQFEPAKGKRFEPAKGKQVEPVKGRQRQAAAAVSRGGRNKTKAGVKA
jgi:hypothetical protein